MDVAATVAVVSSLNQAITMLKTLKGVDDAYQVAEFKLKAAELMGLLYDAKVEMSEQGERIRELERRINVKASMIPRNNFYYQVKDGIEHGPYCQNCFDVKQLEVRLPLGDGTWITCNNCKAVYDNPNGKTSPARFLDTSYDPDDY